MGRGHYVHSGIDNFVYDGKLEVLNTNPRSRFGKDVRQSIEQLKKISTQLKHGTEDFLKGSSVDELNRCLKEPSTKYSDTMHKLLTDNIAKYADILAPKIKVKEYIDRKLTKDGNLTAQGKRFVKALADEGISNAQKDEKVKLSVSAMVKPVLDAIFPSEISTMDRGSVKRNMTIYFNKENGEITKEMNKYNYKYFKTKTGNLKKFVTELLKEQLADMKMLTAGEEGVQNLLGVIKGDFEDATDGIDFTTTYNGTFDKNEYFRLFQTAVEKALGKYSGEFSNAVGDVGEEIRVAAENADELAVTILLGVGKIAEKDVPDYAKKALNTTIKEMNTYKSTDKQSPSDVIVRLRNGAAERTTKVARAQIKTSTKDYTVYIEDENKNKNPVEKQIMTRIQESRNLDELLEAIENTYIKIADRDTLITTIANVCWFKTHKSVQRGTGPHIDEGVPSSKVDVFPTLNKNISVAMSRAITDFLGVTIDNTVNGLQPIISASNLFYIANGWYTPTYEIIDKVIAAMEAFVKDNDINLSNSTFYTVVEDNPNIDWNIDNPKEFWIDKVEGWEEGGKNENHDYGSTQEVGESQGIDDILTKIKVHSNLRLTSFVF